MGFVSTSSNFSLVYVCPKTSPNGCKCQHRRTSASGQQAFQTIHCLFIVFVAKRLTPFGITLVKAGFLRGGGSAPPPWPVRTPWVLRPLPPRSLDLGGPELAAGLLLRGAFAPLGPLWWFWGGGAPTTPSRADCQVRAPSARANALRDARRLPLQTAPPGVETLVSLASVRSTRKKKEQGGKKQNSLHGRDLPL